MIRTFFDHGIPTLLLVAVVIEAPLTLQRHWGPLGYSHEMWGRVFVVTYFPSALGSMPKQSLYEVR